MYVLNDVSAFNALITCFTIQSPLFFMTSPEIVGLLYNHHCFLMTSPEIVGVYIVLFVHGTVADVLEISNTRV